MSTETKWTPGARKVMTWGSKFLVAQAGFPGKHVAQFRNVDDAHLDASAPALYDALSRFERFADDRIAELGELSPEMQEVLDFARTALASARGEG